MLINVKVLVQLNTWNYKTTNDFIDYLDFHDCIIEKIIIEEDLLIIDFKFIYVSEKHPINPYSVAKSTDRCRLTFNKVASISSTIHFDENKEKVVPITDLEEMEILEFKSKPLESFILFEMFGTDWRTYQFCGINVKAKNFTLQWNKFAEDAWYVE